MLVRAGAQKLHSDGDDLAAWAGPTEACCVAGAREGAGAGLASRSGSLSLGPPFSFHLPPGYGLLFFALCGRSLSSFRLPSSALLPPFSPSLSLTEDNMAVITEGSTYFLGV